MGAAAQVLGTRAAKLNSVSPPPVSGSSGKLSAFESCTSRDNEKLSVTCHSALKPMDFSSFLCSRCCCSKPKSLAVPSSSVQYQRGRDRVAGVELDVVEAVRVHPQRLVAAILGQIGLRVRVVGGEGEGIGRRELHGQLCIRALTLAIGEVIADVVRNCIQRAGGRCIDDGCVRSRTCVV